MSWNQQSGYGQQRPPAYGGYQPPGGHQPPGGYQPQGQYQQRPPVYGGHQQNQQPYNPQYNHQNAGGYSQQRVGYQQAGNIQYQSGQAGPVMGGQQAPHGVDSTLWGWFQAVDRDKSGQITADELQQALLNNNWSHFNAETCRLMIGMFDKDRSGTIDIYEFTALWKYVQDWKACFDGFDRDRSGTIDQNELSQAFTSFGYRLSPQFCDLCVRVFDRTNVRTMKFDDFIQCCVMLKTLTGAFRKYDTQQRGVININYEQFLEMVLDNTLSGI